MIDFVKIMPSVAKGHISHFKKLIFLSYDSSQPLCCYGPS